ncbi:ligase-associated DNA damage response endonuclease PdeM [Hufsiella ginkgonis]|uniref:Ligase-associated DNA damage response endonuclease PdeM n=1 Tax=Hufsiella ginkgonis TaxID=2695274 RepID=A0A7K1XRU3_9SPHI|nr:ligase-associated DNA damage response endonuclease PdeM [Hufsiella ginkgonis]MXV13721.1 ligase-associated DNA damage response endonuclease PdeM [Hufsiella ginkgonis]
MILAPIPHNWKFKAQQLILLPQKAMYWKEQEMLIVADVHLGKVGHFRKAGIAIPRLMEQEDLAVLSDLVREYHPKTVLFLGDLFHSDMNNDWEWLILWRDLFPGVRMILVRGNHDILHDRYYHAAQFEVVEDYVSGPFLFSHEPVEDPGDLYAISGHIHSGIRLYGKGRQSVVLPCFFFGLTQAILPAFGRFTGHVALKHTETDHVFGLLKHKVIPLSL